MTHPLDATLTQLDRVRAMKDRVSLFHHPELLKAEALLFRQVALFTRGVTGRKRT